MSKFAPPAVEENVAVNVVPLVDIMFLLLLFLMVGGDMSHRESTELQLPKANMAVPSDREAAGKTYTVINIHLLPENPTEADKRDVTKWAFAISGVEYTDYFQLLDGYTDATGEHPGLKAIAATDREETPIEGTKDKYLSKRFITIRGDKDAPYGLIQQAMQACSEALLYKIEVGAAKPAE